MVEQYTAPIQHSGASATAHTAAGAAVGAAKKGATWWGVTTAVGAGIGLLVGLTFIGAFGPIGAGALTVANLGLTAAGIAKGIAVVGATIGGGALFATTLGPVFGAIGAAIGGVKGGEKAHDRVRDERGAALTMQAQIDMIRAQNPVGPATNIYVPTANNYTMAPNSFPEQGTKMNPAMPVIQGNSVQYDGLAMNQQRVAMV